MTALRRRCHAAVIRPSSRLATLCGSFTEGSTPMAKDSRTMEDSNSSPNPYFRELSDQQVEETP